MICSGFYINRGVKRENRWEKTLMTGFGIFILCLSLARIFYFLGEMEIIGAYKNQGFYGDFSKVSSSYEFYNRMYYLVVDACGVSCGLVVYGKILVCKSRVRYI